MRTTPAVRETLAPAQARQIDRMDAIRLQIEEISPHGRRRTTASCAGLESELATPLG